MKKSKRIFIVFIFAQTTFVMSVGAQETFNPFDEVDGDKKSAISIGGEVSAGAALFFEDMKNGTNEIRIGDLVKARLNFNATGKFVEAAIKLKLTPRFDGGTPLELDEAFLNVFPVSSYIISLGLKKISWGKADSNSVLDVINPHDYSDLSELTEENIPKTARPLIHLAANFGSAAKLELVFLPWFLGDKFAESGRWQPQESRDMQKMIADFRTMHPAAVVNYNPAGIEELSKLSYYQYGARISASASHVDFGFQVYSGFLPRPSYDIKIEPSFIPTNVNINQDYNRYSQFGGDCAFELLGFNIRAEAAINLTSDFSGDDGSVYNGAIYWSFGFDRDVAGLFNINLQCSEKIIQRHEETQKTGINKLYDTESDTHLTNTRITSKISRGFFKDNFRIKFISLWDIEYKNAVLIPSIAYSLGDYDFELSCGVFTGESKGELGQYHENSFIKALAKFVF